MHSPFFITVLSLLVKSSAARPIRQTGFVSIPIFKIPTSVSDVHPVIVHQQHANRGIKRLARMKGRIDDPPDRQLLLNIQSRLLTLPRDLQTRYNHAGIADVLIHKHLGSPHVNGVPEGKLNALEVSETSAGGSSIETAPDNATNSSVTKSDTPTFHHSIGLEIQSNDVGYIGTVQIGSPPRDFMLLIDSGSADMWVGVEGCQGDDGGSCGKHNFLGPKSSSSYNDTQEKWSITYNTGSVSGHLVEDDVTIAGYNLKAFKFGVAHNESEEFTSDAIPFDGLLGFARSVISQQGTSTLVESLHRAGLITDAITSYKVPRLADGKNDGELTLGAMDPSKFDPHSLVTVSNVNVFGFWEAKVDAIKVNGNDMGWSNRTAILDTGTTLIIAPQEDVNAIHNAIPGAKFDGAAWTVPCSTNATFSLSFGGQEFNVDSRDLAFSPIDEKNPTGDCTSGFSQGKIGPFDTEWLVGDVFLKNVYLSTNANIEKNEISIAKLVA